MFLRQNYVSASELFLCFWTHFTPATMFLHTGNGVELDPS